MRCKSTTSVPWSVVIEKGRVMRLIKGRHVCTCRRESTCYADAIDIYGSFAMHMSACYAPYSLSQLLHAFLSCKVSTQVANRSHSKPLSSTYKRQQRANAEQHQQLQLFMLAPALTLQSPGWGFLLKPSQGDQGPLQVLGQLR